MPARESARRVPPLHGLPESREPYWFRAGHPLAAYQSAPALPPHAAVVVIGAGLTGASAAYHLATAGNTGLIQALRGADRQLLMLEHGDADALSTIAV